MREKNSSRAKRREAQQRRRKPQRALGTTEFRNAMPDFNHTELSALPVSIAINALLEEGSCELGEPTRGYLGASSIGHECMRRVQYDWLCDQVNSLQTRDR